MSIFDNVSSGIKTLDFKTDLQRWAPWGQVCEANDITEENGNTIERLGHNLHTSFELVSDGPGNNQCKLKNK